MRMIVMGFLAVLVFAGCADTVSFTLAVETELVGFWYGLWHGLIVVVAFVVSLFDESVSIYALYNNGAWYDFGYLLGLMMTLGGSKRSFCYSKTKFWKDGKHTKITIDVESVDNK